METDTSPGPLITAVLDDLAAVVAAIRPEQLGDPTPCREFDVATLRRHILGWLNFFGAAFSDPAGQHDRPDPKTYTAPDDPAAAVEVVRSTAAAIKTAVEQGVADRPVLMVGSELPGATMLRMVLWEYLAHGSDLARATGRPWNPPAAAVEDSLRFAPGMLTDDYRGPDKDFGEQVAVDDDAPALDRLLAFCGRDPGWKP